MLKLLPLTLLLSGASVFSVHAAQFTQDVKLTSATLFLSAAEMNGTSEINLPAGQSEIIFTHLAKNVDYQSINVMMDHDVQILSSSLRTVLAQNDETATLTQLQKRIADAELEVSRLNARKESIAAQLLVLENNQTLSGKDKAVSAADVAKYLQLVQEKNDTLLTARAELDNQIKVKTQEIAELRKQNQDDRPDSLTENQIVVKVFTPAPVTSQATVSYITPLARWTPAYDVRASAINQPVTLVYKARIQQHTGLNWENIALTLSTVRPDTWLTSQTLEPQYIGLPSPKDKGFMSGSLRIAASPSEKGSADGASSLSTRSRKVQPENSVGNHQDFTGASYTLSLPWNIESDNIPRTVALKEQKINGKFRYYAVPKINPSAFLQVQVADWETLDLIPGESQIFFANNKTGNGYLEAPEEGKTLDITLQQDTKIIIQRREMLKKANVVSLFDNDAVRNFSYTLNVKNSYAQPVDLTVVDQIPVSTTSDIVIEKAQLGGAQLDKETGNVEWTLHLNARENRKIPFSYSVKYPKNARVTGL